jgi:hypothetical protein
MIREIRELVEQARAVPIEAEVTRRGIKLRGGIDRAGPCPVCGGTDRFSINVKKQVFNCRGAVGGNIITMVQHLDDCDFVTAIATLTGGGGDTHVTHVRGELRGGVQARTRSSPAKKQNVAEYEVEQHRKAAWLWSQRKPITGTIAERYLRPPSRGITCTLPPTLAFLPPTKPGHHPAMIAAFALVDEPEPGLLAEPRNVTSVHLTLLKPDGTGKAAVEKPKIVVGSPGALPIILAPPNDLLGLAITEGIEDALTAHEATGLGAWAAGSAGRMPALANIVPAYIEAITIYAHADKAVRTGPANLLQLSSASASKSSWRRASECPTSTTRSARQVTTPSARATTRRRNTTVPINSKSRRSTCMSSRCASGRVTASKRKTSASGTQAMTPVPFRHDNGCSRISSVAASSLPSWRPVVAENPPFGWCNSSRSRSGGLFVGSRFFTAAESYS